MNTNFNLPYAWPEDDSVSSTEAMPIINTQDKGLMAIIRAASELSERERNLALLIIQSITIWSGVQPAEAEGTL